MVRYFHWATLLCFTLFLAGPLYSSLLFPLGHFALLFSIRWATLIYFTLSAGPLFFTLLFPLGHFTLLYLFRWATLLYFTFSTYLYFFHFTILVFTVAICGKQLMQFNTTNKQRVFLQVYNLKQVF